jgi:hypothetical protein
MDALWYLVDILGVCHQVRWPFGIARIIFFLPEKRRESYFRASRSVNMHPNLCCALFGEMLRKTC